MFGMNLPNSIKKQLDHEKSTLDHEKSTLDHEKSTVDHEKSTVLYQFRKRVDVLWLLRENSTGTDALGNGDVSENFFLL